MLVQSASLRNIGPVSALMESPTIRVKACNLVFRENTKVLEVEDQLLCPDVQDEAEINCNELKNSFEFFQRKLRQVVLEAKHKRKGKMHQLKIHDVFKPQTFS